MLRYRSRIRCDGPESRGKGAWSPASLFAAGEQGVWYDPSDFNTLFQDSAGTTAVTGTGQFVGKILDKSGRGNHASQATSSARPTLEQDASGRYYLNFDGTDDGLATGTVDLSGTNKLSIFAGVRKLSDAVSYGIVLEHTSSWAGAGGFTLMAPGTSGGYFLGSTGSLNASVDIGGYAAPITNVLAGLSDISTDSLALRINGSQVGTSAADQGTGNYASSTIQIGKRSNNTFFLTARLYGIILLGRTASGTEITSTETWMNAKTGAY